ncbi:hypothetical protein [Microcoleus sp. B5-D4]
MPVPQNLIFLWNGHLAPLLGTGKMPVPQNLIFLWNGHLARSQRNYF